MTCSFCAQNIIERAIFVSIMTSILLCHACAKPPQTLSHDIQKTAPSNASNSACINVEGKVRGDLIPHSTVSLYETSSVNFSIVMTEIRTGRVLKRATVNESMGFIFPCLSAGNYAFVIPTSSYRGTVGFPLPYEFDCQNFSLEIAFQGGDSQYAVGAFSIRNSSDQNKSACTEDPLSCLTPKGAL